MTSVDASNTHRIESNVVTHLKKPVNPALKGIKYVIFPRNRMTQAWDCVMIIAIWYYAFYIPYRFGIRPGPNFTHHRGFLVFNVIMNALFSVDTVLTFFRAYHDRNNNGRLVFSLKSIRRHYIRSGWFFIDVLASLPVSLVMFLDEGNDDENTINPLFYLELFKLLRLARVKKVMQTSELISRFWERINIEVALSIKFSFSIVLVSHWIACIWGLIAFSEAGSFGVPLLEGINWISGWYNSSYVEGGINPIGWENAIPRYWLCLFWSIQSITSIGYGNIAPVTTTEFAFANLLMLASGIFWAYIIGNLVGVVQSMDPVAQEYVRRMNEANQMMRDFTVQELPESIAPEGVYENSSKRVRRFITKQRDLKTKSWAESNSYKLVDVYPTLRILSPGLQQTCALHLTQSLIETVPYLSSKYLSPQEQAIISMQSVTLEFSATEMFTSHPDLGRGILIFRHGMAVTTRKGRDIGPNYFTWHNDLVDKPIDVNEVLVEDGLVKDNHLIFHFTSFTKVFFVPRSVIFSVLENNEQAWKECARWRYFMAAFVMSSLEKSGNEFHDCL